MTRPQWISVGWNIFFTLISVIMFVTLAAPAFFGLQNFTQWGGMYDEHWCHADLYSADPFSGTVPKYKRMTAGSQDRRVYSSPAHNQLSCAAWGRQFCGKKIDGQWAAVWVSPMLKGIAYLDKQNACDMPELDDTSSWFFHAKK